MIVWGMCPLFVELALGSQLLYFLGNLRNYFKLYLLAQLSFAQLCGISKQCPEDSYVHAMRKLECLAHTWDGHSAAISA